MAQTRIFMVLGGLGDAQEAQRMILSAYHQAANPLGLRFAVSKRYEHALLELVAEDSRFPQRSLCFYGERSGLVSAATLVEQEPFFLALQGEYTFAPLWDQKLQKRYDRIDDRDALMTGTMGAECEGLEPQAYLPAFTRHFEPDCVEIERGLPLVCSEAPVKTLVVDPALMYGPVELLGRMELRPENLSVAAHVACIPVYALDEPVLWPLQKLRMHYLQRPTETQKRIPSVARFEQLAGFAKDPGALSLRFALGLYGASETYPQKLPGGLNVKSKLRQLFHSAGNPAMPYFVSAFIDLPQPKKPDEVYMQRFGYLNAMRNLPLMVYTGGRCERQIRSICLNARSYPERSLLPRQYGQRSLPPKDHLGRNKWLLLRKTAVAFPNYSHVAWINLDMLHHPICPDVMPDFSALMDDRIHLAVVNGVPDSSFMVVPAHRLGLITRECEAITQIDAVSGRSLTEDALVMRLYSKYSDLFALHPMPGKHLLFHWALDRRLVDAKYRSVLALAGEAQRPASVTIESDGKEVEL